MATVDSYQGSASSTAITALPEAVQEFVWKLITVDPSPDEIWLIGSRANGRATESSDTDLLIFASPDFKKVLTSTIAPQQDVDCLVVGEDGEYADAWKEKTGSLAELQWNRECAAVARYVGVKWIPDPPEERDERQDASIELGMIQRREERAIRLYPGS